MSATREAVVPPAPAVPAEGASSLVEALLAHAANRPNEVALVHKRLGLWHPMTWAELHERVRRAAEALGRLGLRRGEPVAILSDARPAWLITDLAVQAAGGVSIAVHPTQSAADLRTMLAPAPVRFAFCGDEEQLALAGEALEGLTRRVILDPRFLTRSHEEDSEAYLEFLARAGDTPADLDAPPPDEMAIGVASAGTRGAPRIALFTHRTALAAARSAAQWLALRPGEHNLCVVCPAQGTARLLDLYAPLVAGATMAFPESPETIPENLLEIAPDVLLLIPRALELLKSDVELRGGHGGRVKRAANRWAARRRAGSGGRAARSSRLLVDRAIVSKLGLARARRVVCAGGAAAPELLSFFWDLGVPVTVTYGQAETFGLLSAQRDPSDVGTAGPPLPGVELREHDGNLRARGAVLAGAYLDGAPVVGSDGWLDTADRGTLDEDGRVVVQSAAQDVLRRPGQDDVLLGEVEARLRLSPYVGEAVALAGDAGVTALIQIEVDVVAEWALREGLTGATFAALAASPEVRELIAGEIERANTLLPEHERVRDFRLLPRRLSVGRGEMTPTLRVRRGVVVETFDQLAGELRA